MTAQVIFALIDWVAIVTGLALAWRGWLVRIPDGEKRYRARMWAWLMAAAVVWASFAEQDTHPWWSYVFSGICALIVFDHIETWWKRAEVARREALRTRG